MHRIVKKEVKVYVLRLHCLKCNQGELRWKDPATGGAWELLYDGEKDREVIRYQHVCNHCSDEVYLEEKYPQRIEEEV